MTRLAYDLGDWGNISFTGDQVLTADQIAREADTLASARLWDPRPLRTTLDQLQTVRKYYDFTGVDTDRYIDRRRPAPGDALGARARARAEPERVRLGQPADPVHPRGRGGDGPGQRGRQRRPAAAARQQPAAGLDQWRAADRSSPLGHLLRRAAELVRRRRGAAERVRLPDRRERHRGLDRHRDALDGHDRDRARQDAQRDCSSRRASATSTCSSATRSPRAASCSSIARSATACRWSRRSCASTRTPTS